MSGETGLRVDMTDFDKNFILLMAETIPMVVGEALYDEGLQLLDDADNKGPQTPWKEGDLRASRVVERPLIRDGEIMVRAGFNMPYAEYQEAGQRKDGSRVVKNYTTDRIPGPGSHFLGQKLVPMAKERFARIAAYIKGHAK
jgi:hypothetical protein